ncbi:S-adenosyl-L-methionine-dependent methyltransferase [Chytridium lagenaria]|nr:S-adenosyl-L-methionine-dependent methyltransferase [Chytridium lagenaria]
MQTIWRPLSSESMRSSIAGWSRFAAVRRSVALPAYCAKHAWRNHARGFTSPMVATEIKKEPLTDLTKHLMDLIKISGPISVAQFMRQALTHPLGGYYMKQDVFGTKGDFVTSPEISQMFGELLAIWFISQWQATGMPKNVHMVELGPGRGTLMADMMRTFKQFKDFKAAIKSVHMVEASPFLRTTQAKKLLGRIEAIESRKEYADVDGIAFRWHDSVDEVDTVGVAYVVAHEYLDALPVFKFQKTKDGWREIMVDVDEGKLSPLNFRLVKSTKATKATTAMLQSEKYEKLPLGSLIELSPETQSESQKIGKLVKKTNGAALLIDYGNDHISGDTIRGIREHKFTSFMSSPGDTDITADVDFSLVRDSASQTGAFAHGPLTQGDFLRFMGITQRLQALLNVCAKEEREELAKACERLVGPSIVNGMGEIYKVMVLTSTEDVPYPFFMNTKELPKKESA